MKTHFRIASFEEDFFIEIKAFTLISWITAQQEASHDLTELLYQNYFMN
jgi:hypothetical protein